MKYLKTACIIAFVVVFTLLGCGELDEMGIIGFGSGIGGVVGGGGGANPALTGTVTIDNMLPEVNETITASYSPGNGSGTPSWVWLRDNTVIAGATGSSYDVVIEDLGSTLRAQASFSNRSGSVTSAATEVVTNTGLEVLTGTVTINNTSPAVGSSLTATYNPGNGSGSPSWQWFRGATAIPSATSATYIVDIADAGSTLRARVIYSGNRSNVMSAATSAVPLPALTGTVSITGTAEVGQTLTANIGSLVGFAGANSFQWRRGGTNIGTNSNTYVIQPSDAGSTITVIVTRANHTGNVTSSPTAPIILPPLTGTVSITGTTTVGQMLTANTESLGGTGAISYQWRRGETNIGPNSPTYTLVQADSGSTISVIVTRAGNSGSVTSGPTASIANAPLSGTVSITGSTVVGETLTANTGSLGGDGTISYQWRRGATDIGTGSTYVVQAADIGSTITVTVTRVNNTGSVTSPPTSTITAAPLPPLSGSVNITGTTTVGQTLTANTGALAGSGAISYQWRRGATDIGTNSSTYTLVQADSGSTITVTVTRADNSGSVTSSPTAVIANAALTGTVSITGTAIVGETISANTSLLGGSGDISYQWRRAGADITGANSQTYTIVQADSFSSITVNVTRVNNTGSVTSSLFGPVSNAPLTGTVSIDGNAVVGQTLTANISSLDGSGGILYQWVRTTGSVGVGAGSTYVVQAADLGSTITVTVTRSNHTGSITSDPTAVVINPALTGTVSITGTTTVGETLTVNTGSLGGSGDISYQWRRGATDIGTDSNTYTLVQTDSGSTITVTVTRANNSGSVTSLPTASIANAALTGTVSITGTAEVGQTLTASYTPGNNSGAATWTWLRGDTVITGANSSTYNITTADVGFQLRARVSYSGNTGSVTSNPTAAVVSNWAPGESFWWGLHTTAYDAEDDEYAPFDIDVFKQDLQGNLTALNTKPAERVNQENVRFPTAGNGTGFCIFISPKSFAEVDLRDVLGLPVPPLNIRRYEIEVNSIEYYVYQWGGLIQDGNILYSFRFP